MYVFWSLFCVLLVFLLYVYLQWKIRAVRESINYEPIAGVLILAQQEQNIYNISGRVPSQNPTQYPDAFLSIDHISITTELNKPPKYDDAPPSYEEALKLAIAQSNSMQTLQAEQPRVHQSTTSTSSSTPVVVPAVPSRTTE